MENQGFLLQSYARFPVSFLRGHSAYLFDKNGQDYIDFGSGIGVCSLGHTHQGLNEALKNQLDSLLHISNLYENDLQTTLAQKIIELSKQDFSIFFSNSGAEANECAIKIARKFGEKKGPKCYEIITLESSFHGRTIATLIATGQPKLHQHFGPFPEGFKIAKNISSIKEMINDQTCAVFLELIQGEGGIHAFDQSEIKELAQLLKQKNILLMIDEVQSGSFRSGEFLASHLYDLKPDIITLAKGLGGGIPIGATLCNIKDIFSPGDHGSTFGGNPFSSRAGLFVLDTLAKERESGRLKQRIDLFDKKLQEIFQTYPHIFSNVAGLGLMRGLKIHKKEMQTKILQTALQERVLVIKSGSDTIRFLPPLTILQEEIEEGFSRFHKAIKQL